MAAHAHHAVISLTMDKPYYISGEVINGTTGIVVSTPIPASAIKIRFKGYEKTHIENTYKDSDGNIHTNVYKDDKTFFNQEVVLYQINQVLPPGTYNYPFQYHLPAGLPGIFFDERREWDGDKVKGMIVYKVKVWLEMPGAGKKKELKKSEKIVISEALCRQITPMHDTKEKGFMFAKGKLKMSYALDKNVFCPGEQIPVKVKVDNESTKKVNHIKIKLMRDLQIRAKGFSKRITEEMNRMEFEGVGEKSAMDKVIPFTVAGNVFPTSLGHLVQCQYHLDIECDVPMAFDLEHHVPVVLALMPSVPMAINLYATYTPIH
jgi:hypothetical protein